MRGRGRAGPTAGKNVTLNDSFEQVAQEGVEHNVKTLNKRRTPLLEGENFPEKRWTCQTRPNPFTFSAWGRYADRDEGHE